MWALSRNSERGRVTLGGRCWRSPGGMVRTALKAGWPARLVAALEAQRQLRLEGEGGAVGGLEGGGDGDRLVVGCGGEVEARAEHGRGGRGRFAAGRVEGEFGAVDVGADVAQVDGDAVDDVGDRVGAGGVDEDFGGFGVDLEGEADDDGAEVEGADLGGGDRDERERGAVVGAGEVELAGGVGEDVADAGADQGVADFGGGRAGGAGFALPRRRLRVRGLWRRRSPRRSSRGCRRACRSRRGAA